MAFSFFALVSRMKNISRWALMRNSYSENVQEHSHMVAVIAHALAVIRRDEFGLPADPDRAASAALFHDASEILTGDMPTPVKYFNPEIMAAYKQVESVAAGKLLGTIPEKMRPAYEELLLEKDKEVARLVKGADKLAAYIKCLEELRAGNDEFSRAAQQTLESIHKMNMPEAEYFLENFIPAFKLTIDDMDFSGK